jgi:hypothetical protein
MPTPDRFLSQLKELRVKHALEALSPSQRNRSAFDYGYACGVAYGLELAERVFSDEIGEESESQLARPPSGTTRPGR